MPCYTLMFCNKKRTYINYLAYKQTPYALPKAFGMILVYSLAGCIYNANKIKSALRAFNLLVSVNPTKQIKTA